MTIWLYVFVVPFIAYLVTFLRIENLVKKGKVLEARLIYLVITIAVSYLVVSFLTDIVPYP